MSDKFDLSAGPSTQFGNDTSKMGHRDYTEWRKAGGSHDVFMEWLDNNPDKISKGSNLKAELMEHGQNRDFREGDKNPENTEFGWLGWDNVGDFSYDKLSEDNESPYDDDYEESEELSTAKTRVKAYEDDRLMGGPDSNYSAAWYNTSEEPTVAEGSGQTDATPSAQAFMTDYSANLQDKMKKGSRDAFGEVDVWSAADMK